MDKEGNFGDGKNTIYLKADYKAKKSLSTDISKLTDADITKYKNMNPLWAAERGSIAPASWNDNEKAAAWLCAPSVWKAYADSSIVGSYAIGAPSAEMFVASYNDVSHTQAGNYTLGATYRATRYPGYIYTLNGKQSNISNSDYYTGTDSLDYKGYNSMYAGTNGRKTGVWRLASPSSNNSDYVCGVYGNNALLNNYSYNDAHGVGPLVSLPSTFTVEVEQ